MKRYMIMAMLLCCVAGLSVWAADTATERVVTVTRKPIELSVISTETVTELAADETTIPGKFAGIYQVSQSGGPAVITLLVRIQDAGNGTYLEIVVDDTLANLDTQTGTLALTNSHPSAAEDAADTAALAAAAE